jgi:hypothetical protein
MTTNASKAQQKNEKRVTLLHKMGVKKENQRRKKRSLIVCLSTVIFFQDFKSQRLTHNLYYNSSVVSSKQ